MRDGGKMKTFYITVFLGMFFQQAAFAQYQHCGNDYNCYYETKARIFNEYREKQEVEEDRYRAQQLELQQEQLETVQEQNSIMEKQLQELNERQERMEMLQTQQLDEIKKQQRGPEPEVKSPPTKQQTPEVPVAPES